tara:strand:+ start:206 stop:403 length:198 start_codon:yes stop_codon:yes gene_type:complete
MSHRSLSLDPDVSRRKAYEALEKTGESQEGLWEALEAIQATGIDLGEKATAILLERQKIKQARPK